MNINSMEQRVTRMKDAHTIENLLCKYSYYLTAGEIKTLTGYFSETSEDITISLSSVGVWTGKSGLKRFFDYLMAARGNRIGQLEIHLVTNLVIQVSEDCRTAQAVLVSPGVSTGPMDGYHLASGWDWAKANVSLIKEGGQWKIVRLEIYDLFYAPYGHSFVGQKKSAPQVSGEFAPDYPAASECMYSSTGVQPLIPVPPKVG